jgi:hypothetical protein
MDLLLQVGADYQLSPWRWLVGGSRLRFVWMPDGTLFHRAWSASPFVAVNLGRWRLEGEAVVNLSAPYGFVRDSRRIWALGLKLGRLL